MDTLKNVNIPQTKPADDVMTVSSKPETEHDEETNGTTTPKPPKNGAAERQVQIADYAELEQQLSDCKNSAVAYQNMASRTDSALHDALAKSYIWWRACTQVDKRVEGYLGDAEIKAKWRDGSLVVKTKTDRRTTTETYFLTEGGSLLTVVVEVEGQGPMGSLSFKRIYRPPPS